MEIDPSGELDSFFSFTFASIPSACTFRSRFFWDKRRKLLLMMKTKGCEEKWGFVKSLCKNLIKRTTWHFFPFSFFLPLSELLLLCSMRREAKANREMLWRDSSSRFFIIFSAMKNVIFIQIPFRFCLFSFFLPASFFFLSSPADIGWPDIEITIVNTLFAIKETKKTLKVQRSSSLLFLSIWHVLSCWMVERKFTEPLWKYPSHLTQKFRHLQNDVQ